MTHNYKARLNTRAGSPNWAHEFTADTDISAIQQVKDVLQSDFGDVGWLMSVDLFTTATKDYKMVTFGYERHVANFRIGAPEIIVKVST